MSHSQEYFSEDKVAQVAGKMNEISRQYEQLFVDLGKQIFVDIVDSDDASKIVSVCAEWIDKALVIFEQQFPDSSAVACTKGCCYCCFFPIECPPQVIIDIARYMKKQLSIDTRQQILKKMAEDGKKRKKPFFRAQCPFLDDQKTCMIYEKRPFSCRWFTSPDAALCRQSVVDGSNIPQQTIRHRVYQVATTMLLACAKEQGRPHTQKGFIPAVLEIFDDSKTVETWNGYPVF